MVLTHININGQQKFQNCTLKNSAFEAARQLDNFSFVETLGILGLEVSYKPANLIRDRSISLD
jgi:hypothetical protein